MKKKTSKKEGEKINPNKGAKPWILSDLYGYSFLMVVLLLITFVRVRLLSFPLERDEGEYAYFGQLILQGIPPYSIAFNLKLPGTYYCYALIMSVFGQSPVGIRTGLLLFNIASVIMLFFIARKLYNNNVAAIASAVYGILTVGPGVLGQAAHANQFVTFFALAAMLLLLIGMQRESLFYYALSGFFFTLAFISKQSAVFFILFGVFAVFLHPVSNPVHKLRHIFIRFLVFSVGAIVPLLIMLISVYLNGVYERFWFWTVTFPAVYGSRIPFSAAWESLMNNLPIVTKSHLLIWICAVLGVVALFLRNNTREQRWFTGLLFLFSVLTVIPGFYFRPHYFIPLLPVSGILTGVFFDTLGAKLSNRIKWMPKANLILVTFILLLFLYMERSYYFKDQPGDLCRSLYPICSFNESAHVAGYINANTRPDDKVLVFGSEPQILFLANRKSATGYIYMFDLVYNHPYALEMQKEMIGEVEKAKPAIIVYVSEVSSWMVSPDANPHVLNWFNEYVKKYTLVGVADIPDYGPTEYAWGDAATGYKNQSNHFLHVLKRIGD